MNLFFELVQVALGNREMLSRVPSVCEWDQIDSEAQRQAVSGIIVDGLDKLPEAQLPKRHFLLRLVGDAEMIRQRNQVLNKRCIEIQQLFADAGFRSCVLKGQGNAQMYPNPTSRMPGDIDLWVDGERKAINTFVDQIVKDAHKGYKDVAFHYKDVEVEAHYFPTYLNGYSKNKLLQNYIEENKEAQFTHKVGIGEGHELCVPTDDFNVVYQMCHIYLHFFCEGIGLRHFIDYYFVLKRFVDIEEIKLKSIQQFQELGLLRFVMGVMWIEKEVLGLSDDYLLVEEDEKTGKMLLKEILEYGNFNKADMKGKSVAASKLSNTFRPFKYLFQFPKDSIDRLLFHGRLLLWKAKSTISESLLVR